MTPEELVHNYPVLHHMAEPGSWDAIRQIGLCTTRQLVKDCGLPSDAAAEILETRRKASVRLQHPTVGSVTVRDQSPLREHNLAGVTLQEWLALLNDHVFFWLHPARLDGLLAAKLYRDQAHDVLEVRTRDLLERHGDRVRITGMNTGATIFPSSPRRGPDTFMRVKEFPFTERRRGRALKYNAVELAVIDGVPDMAELVCRVERRRGDQVLEVLLER
ncbi:MAG: hypothetical protein LH603_04390 [Pseudonocardia sp.]|nr:hypothetical protein [Pseudonocardia sp.]